MWRETKNGEKAAATRGEDARGAVGWRAGRGINDELRAGEKRGQTMAAAAAAAAAACNKIRALALAWRATR